MKKLAKILAAFMMAATCFFLAPVISSNAEEDMRVVYASVPSDWQNPCVWAWDADGNGAFDAWPGGAMKADENNEGWYYIYVPSTMSNVIVNANEGSVQTADFSTDGLDAWFTVVSAEEVTVSNEKMTEGDIPEYVPTFKVFAKVDETWTAPGLWAWSAPDGTNAFAAWPGETMKENSDGFYSMEVPTWVNSVIVNANEGTVQTADITVEAKDLWLVVAADGTYELSYEKPAEDMITVHVKVPEDWLLPCLWAWSAPDGTNAFVNWPGEEFTLEGDWYVKQAPNWINSVIANGNLGTVQTSDISVDAGKDIWIVVKSADEYELFYEEPATEATVAPEAPQEEKEEATVEAPVETVAEKTFPTGLVCGIAGGVVVILAVVFVVIKKKRQ